MQRSLVLNVHLSCSHALFRGARQVAIELLVLVCGASRRRTLQLLVWVGRFVSFAPDLNLVVRVLKARHYFGRLGAEEVICTLVAPAADRRLRDDRLHLLVRQVDQVGVGVRSPAINLLLVTGASSSSFVFSAFSTFSFSPFSSLSSSLECLSNR